MSLSCVIEVEGRDRGKLGNGRPKNTLRRKVGEFLKDSEFYYQAVERHLRDCRKCSPEEALRGFMENREKKRGGATSQLLVKLAVKVKAANPDKVPGRIMSDYVAGAMTTAPLTFYAHRQWLDETGWARAEEVAYRRWADSMKRAHGLVLRYRKGKSQQSKNRLEALLTEDRRSLRERIPYVGFLGTAAEYAKDRDDREYGFWNSDIGRRVIKAIQRVQERAARERDPAIRELIGWMQVHEVLGD